MPDIFLVKCVVPYLWLSFLGYFSQVLVCAVNFHVFPVFVVCFIFSALPLCVWERTAFFVSLLCVPFVLSILFTCPLPFSTSRLRCSSFFCVFETSPLLCLLGPSLCSKTNGCLVLFGQSSCPSYHRYRQQHTFTLHSSNVILRPLKKEFQETFQEN